MRYGNLFRRRLAHRAATGAAAPEQKRRLRHHYLYHAVVAHYQRATFGPRELLSQGAGARDVEGCASRGGQRYCTHLPDSIGSTTKLQDTDLATCLLLGSRTAFAGRELRQPAVLRRPKARSQFSAAGTSWRVTAGCAATPQQQSSSTRCQAMASGRHCNNEQQRRSAQTLNGACPHRLGKFPTCRPTAPDLHRRPQHGGCPLAVACHRHEGRRLRQSRSSRSPTPSPSSCPYVRLRTWSGLVAHLRSGRPSSVAKEFNTIAVDGGIAMSHDGMLAALARPDRRQRRVHGERLALRRRAGVHLHCDKITRAC